MRFFTLGSILAVLSFVVASSGASRISLKINLGGESVGEFVADHEALELDPAMPKTRFHGQIAAESPDAEIFKTQRFTRNEDLVLNIPVPDGIYAVTLLFAEIWEGAYAPGKRVFDVFLGSTPNGVIKVLEGLDPFKAAGPATPLRRKFKNIMAKDGITVALRPIRQHPQIAGIVIEGYSYPETLLRDLPFVPAATTDNVDMSILGTVQPQLPPDPTLLYRPEENLKYLIGKIDRQPPAGQAPPLERAVEPHIQASEPNFLPSAERANIPASVSMHAASMNPRINPFYPPMSQQKPKKAGDLSQAPFASAEDRGPTQTPFSRGGSPYDARMLNPGTQGYGQAGSENFPGSQFSQLSVPRSYATPPFASNVGSTFHSSFPRHHRLLASISQQPSRSPRIARRRLQQNATDILEIGRNNKPRKEPFNQPPGSVHLSKKGEPPRVDCKTAELNSTPRPQPHSSAEEPLNLKNSESESPPSPSSNNPRLDYQKAPAGTNIPSQPVEFVSHQDSPAGPVPTSPIYLKHPVGLGTTTAQQSISNASPANFAPDKHDEGSGFSGPPDGNNSEAPGNTPSGLTRSDALTGSENAAGFPTRIEGALAGAGTGDPSESRKDFAAMGVAGVSHDGASHDGASHDGASHDGASHDSASHDGASHDGAHAPPSAPSRTPAPCVGGAASARPPPPPAALSTISRDLIVVPGLPDLPGLPGLPGVGNVPTPEPRRPPVGIDIDGQQGLGGVCIDNETHCTCGLSRHRSQGECLFVENEQASPMICQQRPCNPQFICACAPGANVLCKKTLARNILVPVQQIGLSGRLADPKFVLCKRDRLPKGIPVLEPIV